MYGDTLSDDKFSGYEFDYIISNPPYVDTDETLFAGYHTVMLKSKVKSENNKYLAYLFLTDARRSQLRKRVSGIKVFSISRKILGETTVILPPLPEQRRIADYLDTACAKIDALIANQQVQIEKLKAYKQSLITEVVTHGLNPDAPMKDSGVEWIGMIPEGWRMIATKYLFDIESGATPKSENADFFDGNIPWITPADYKTEDIFVSGGRRNISKLGFESCSTSLISAGSLIFSKRAPIGAVAINTVDLCTNQGCLSCISKTSDNVKYYYYTMSICTEQYNLLGSGTTFKEISATSFANFILPCPSLPEQKQIADYLDTKCAKIDALIAIKHQKIEKLTEYKKSLIYEYVTGKRELS